MKDREFLIWLHDRLTNHHKEPPNMSFMRRLRYLIGSTSAEANSNYEQTIGNSMPQFAAILKQRELDEAHKREHNNG